tara:strand:+ start:331 stop:900 length:570 start_codon:yes stop_codon:yes gene_type:complete
VTNETTLQWVRIPDLQGHDTVWVSEICVQEGQTVERGDTLLVLDTVKTCMDVLSDFSGVVVKININLSDEVCFQQRVICIQIQVSQMENQTCDQEEQDATIFELVVPDVGTDQVAISELLVSEGSQVAKEDTLFVFESNESSTEFQAPFSGRVVDWQVALGDKVVTGQFLGYLVISDQSLNDRSHNCDK